MTAVRRRVLALALVAIAALVLAACGGGDDGGSSSSGSSGDTLSKEEYGKQLVATVKPVGEELPSIAQSANGASAEEAQSKISEVEQKLEDVTAKVEDLKPPSELQSAHDTYVEKLKALTADVGSLADAIGDKDQAAAQQAAQKVVSDGQAVTQAEQAISQKLNE
jgi:ABC-type glycerol-3-phosphate transport system substrate-binding protein